MPRLMIALCVFGLGCAGLLAALLGFQADSAAGQPEGQSATGATVVTVTAGKPTEEAFTLSRSSFVKAGPVTFKVTNGGALTHTFKICTSVLTTSVLKHTCVGKVTPVLKKGKTATVTITLSAGAHEYLGTEPGDAANGMWGLIGIGVKVTQPARPTTTTKITTLPAITSTTSTTTTATVPLVGDPVNGALIYHSAGCDTCHHLNGVGPNNIDGSNLDATVLATEAGDIAEITGGDTYMPAFSTTLTSAQIDDVAAYVYTQQHR